MEEDEKREQARVQMNLLRQQRREEATKARQAQLGELYQQERMKGPPGPMRVHSAYTNLATNRDGTATVSLRNLPLSINRKMVTSLYLMI